MPDNTATIVAELNALLRLTNTETVIADTRRAQAGSQAIQRELARNADKSRERASLLEAAIRELGGLPNFVGVAAGRLGALAKSQLEQGQDLSQALLGDLALEQQLYVRARFLKVLAEAGGRANVVRVAERLERAHAETIEWLEIRLAEVGVGGPPAIRPTPVQSAVGVARRAATLPARGAATGVNRSLSLINGLRESAAQTLDQQLERAGELKEAAAEIYTAGRNASLKRAERTAREDGAKSTAKAIRATRGSIGGLDSSELPIGEYDELTITEAVNRISKLVAAEDVRTILAYEQAHRARTKVVDAAQARLGAIARTTLKGGEPKSSQSKPASAKRTTSSAKKATPTKAELVDLTVEELREKAADADIEGRSAMNKDELVGALRKA